MASGATKIISGFFYVPVYLLTLKGRENNKTEVLKKVEPGFGNVNYSSLPCKAKKSPL
jgi:hypothetical protein